MTSFHHVSTIEAAELEQRLKENQDNMRVIVDSLPAAVCEWKSDTTLTYANELYKQLFANGSDINGQRWLDFVPENSREAVAKRYAELTGAPRPVSMEHEVMAVDGSRRWLHWTDLPLRNGEGEEAEFLSIGIDITARKEAEAALRRRIDLERFMAEASIGFINLPLTETELAIEAALRGVGPLAEADRCYVFLLDDNGENFSCAHDWCASEFVSQKDKFQAVPLRMYPWWMERLLRFETVHVSRLGDLPPEAGAERRVFNEQGVQSVLLIPLGWQNKARGFLGFDTLRREREWITEDVQVLETLANTFSLALERRENEQERAKLEADLRQAQKMEAVGQLAGGVAHDFNNMLSVILGNAEIIRAAEPGEPIHDELSEITSAAKKSADLTRQLLAFARKQTSVPELLDINETVEGMLKMLRRLIGEDVELTWKPGAGLWRVEVDPTQLDQIVANVTINARDAIGGNGEITIMTSNATLDHAYCGQHPGCIPGDYVALSIQDNGQGMDEATLARVFEPFFTTKEVGKGTGLGLATVYGIVKQNKGYLRASSAPGQGARFDVYLPSALAAQEQDADSFSPAMPRGAETVLVVEDEQPVLNITKRFLERLGYTVLTACGPRQAFDTAASHAGAIDLLLTDMVMPGMNGYKVWRRLSRAQPDMRCLIMSAYSTDVLQRYGPLDGELKLLRKPFSQHSLASAVRDALGAREKAYE